MTAAPWWTQADDAELAVLVHEFVDGVYQHRERCGVCKHGGPWCKPLREAFDEVLNWRRRRSLHSFAIGMRRAEDLREAA